MKSQRFVHPPIRRAPSLHSLSREHMGGLVLARRLTVAGKGDAALRREAMEALLRAWESELRPHFEDEERLLLPYVDDDTMRERLLAEHRRLARFIADAQAMTGAPTGEWLLAAGEALREHIRWEERVFFPRVEVSAGAGGLAEIARASTHIEATRPGARARRTGGAR